MYSLSKVPSTSMNRENYTYKVRFVDRTIDTPMCVRYSGRDQRKDIGVAPQMYSAIFDPPLSTNRVVKFDYRVACIERRVSNPALSRCRVGASEE